MQADDFNVPSRRPWLLVALVLVLGVAAGLRYLRPRPPAAGREAAAPEAGAALGAGPSRSGAAVGPAAEPSAVAPAATGAVAAATGAGPETQARLQLCAQWETEGRLLDARTNALALLKETSHDAERQAVEELLGRVNIALVTTPLAMPEKVEYLVQRGDSLEKIAKTFGTTVALIQKSNGRTNALIKAGDHLRVFQGRFAVAVSKTRNDLLLTMNGEFFKRYPAGTGRYGKTPTGTFVISDKIPEPVWWHPDGKEIPYGDPANILGTRWLALRATGRTLPVKGYGIHGTWDETGIGKAESAGCVRLRNRDVEELFDLLPLGVPVTIAE